MFQGGLCLGLDFKDNIGIQTYIELINSVKVDAFKLNPGFNPRLVEQVAKLLNQSGTPWIYDAKIGDVLHTNMSYAKYVFCTLGASGVTLNPYVGLDALAPFFEYKNKTSFILCKTTNPGFKPAQEASFESIKKFAQGKSNIGLVLPANQAEVLSDFNNIILAPGIGVQGGNIPEDSEPNILYSVSRSIINSPKAISVCDEYYDKVHIAKLKSDLKNKAYIKYSDYTLSSGLKSDYYVDLKAVTSDIDFFKRLSKLMCNKIKNESILGVESGSIAFASAIGVMSNKQFGFVRKLKKDYGEQNIIEATLNKTQPVTIIDDVMTTGKSLYNSIIKARECGYNVDQIVVVVERSNAGRALIEELGIEVISLLKLP